MNHIEFIDILSVNDELRDKVRQWRNKESIRKFMLTQHQISEEEHLKWIKSLSHNDKKKFWVVFANNIPIGSVYLQNISYRGLSSEWGFYIGEDAYTGRGLAKYIVYKLLKDFFEVMKFNVLFTKVFSDNDLALKTYRRFKFAEVGRSCDNSGRKIVTLSFSKSNWEKYKVDFENMCF
jgi:UDP-4-amino-4,6-dideoxy-N-acetyl-beta-L-altrosamine N-acetyltransferase